MVIMAGNVPTVGLGSPWLFSSTRLHDGGPRYIVGSQRRNRKEQTGVVGDGIVAAIRAELIGGHRFVGTDAVRLASEGCA